MELTLPEATECFHSLAARYGAYSCLRTSVLPRAWPPQQQRQTRTTTKRLAGGFSRETTRKRRTQQLLALRPWQLGPTSMRPLRLLALHLGPRHRQAGLADHLRLDLQLRQDRPALGPGLPRLQGHLQLVQARLAQGLPVLQRHLPSLVA